MGLLFSAAFLLALPVSLAYASAAGFALLVVLALAVITSAAGFSDRLALARYVAAPVAVACSVCEAGGESEGTLALAVTLLTSVAAIATP